MAYFSKNLGKRLSIDETSFSNGELYTILTNKAGKGKKGTIVAMIAGTKADTVTAIIEKSSQRAIKSRIILDMAANILLLKNVFQMLRGYRPIPCSKLALEALQEIRIKYRWQAIDQENEAMEKAKKRK
jgi:hypothetical protein